MSRAFLSLRMLNLLFPSLPPQPLSYVHLTSGGSCCKRGGRRHTLGPVADGEVLLCPVLSPPQGSRSLQDPPPAPLVPRNKRDLSCRLWLVG